MNLSMKINQVQIQPRLKKLNPLLRLLTKLQKTQVESLEVHELQIRNIEMFKIDFK